MTPNKKNGICDFFLKEIADLDQPKIYKSYFLISKTEETFGLFKIQNTLAASIFVYHIEAVSWFFKFVRQLCRIGIRHDAT